MWINSWPKRLNPGLWRRAQGDVNTATSNYKGSSIQYLMHTQAKKAKSALLFYRRGLPVQFYRTSLRQATKIAGSRYFLPQVRRTAARTWAERAAQSLSRLVPKRLRHCASLLAAGGQPTYPAPTQACPLPPYNVWVCVMGSSDHPRHRFL